MMLTSRSALFVLKHPMPRVRVPSKASLAMGSGWQVEAAGALAGLRALLVDPGRAITAVERVREDRRAAEAPAAWEQAGDRLRAAQRRGDDPATCVLHAAAGFFGERLGVVRPTEAGLEFLRGIGATPEERRSWIRGTRAWARLETAGRSVLAAVFTLEGGGRTQKDVWNRFLCRNWGRAGCSQHFPRLLLTLTGGYSRAVLWSLPAAERALMAREYPPHSMAAVVAPVIFRGWFEDQEAPSEDVEDQEAPPEDEVRGTGLVTFAGAALALRPGAPGIRRTFAGWVDLIAEDVEAAVRPAWAGQLRPTVIDARKAGPALHSRLRRVEAALTVALSAHAENTAIRIAPSLALPLVLQRELSQSWLAARVCALKTDRVDCVLRHAKGDVCPSLNGGDPIRSSLWLLDGNGGRPFSIARVSDALIRAWVTGEPPALLQQRIVAAEPRFGRAADDLRSTLHDFTRRVLKPEATDAFARRAAPVLRRAWAREGTIWLP